MKKIRKLLSLYGRLLFVLVVLASALLYAMFQGGKVSWTIFYILLPFIIYSLGLFIYPLSNLTAERIIRTPSVQSGERFVVSVVLSRKVRFPLLYTIAGDTFRNREIGLLAGDKLKHLFIFGFRDKVEWEYEVSHMPRGEHILDGVQIEVSDFFGWIQKTHFISVKNTVLVYPKVMAITYVPVNAQYDSGKSTSPFNLVKDTTMATGIRNYQSGDRVSWIHWKSFARTQVLMTKEFEDRRSEEMLLVLDGRPSKVFEEQVELAASILKTVSDQQAGIGFFATGPGQTVFPNIQTEEQLQHSFIHLAKLKPMDDSSIVISSSTSNELRRSSSLILLTGSPDWSFIQSIVIHAKSIRKVICFVVLNKTGKKSEALMADIQFAKTKGITVHTLTPNQFSKAFKEVSRL